MDDGVPAAGGLAAGEPSRRGHLPSEEDSLSSEPIVSSAPPVSAPDAPTTPAVVPTAAASSVDVPSASAPAAARSSAIVESCATCGAALAADQRYCLECGARRSALGSVLTGDMRSLISLASSESAARARVDGPAATAANAASDVAESARPRGGGTSAVIAGVGVLLLAMGVGVLVGRSSSSAKAADPPAQVISVATPAAGAGTDAGTTQTPTSSSPMSSAKHSPAKHASSKSSSSHSSTTPPAGGVGQTPSKPAPPAAAESLKGAKGGNYEQKSKNLPNVISTG